jgi:hypothetical protein
MTSMAISDCVSCQELHQQVAELCDRIDTLEWEQR